MEFPEARIYEGVYVEFFIVSSCDLSFFLNLETLNILLYENRVVDTELMQATRGSVGMQASSSSTYASDEEEEGAAASKKIADDPSHPPQPQHHAQQQQVPPPAHASGSSGGRFSRLRKQ